MTGSVLLKAKNFIFFMPLLFSFMLEICFETSIYLFFLLEGNRLKIARDIPPLPDKRYKNIKGWQRKSPIRKINYKEKTRM